MFAKWLCAGLAVGAVSVGIARTTEPAPPAAAVPATVPVVVSTTTTTGPIMRPNMPLWCFLNNRDNGAKIEAICAAMG